MTTLNLSNLPSRDHTHGQCPECGRLFTVELRREMPWCSHDDKWTWAAPKGFEKTQILMIGPSSPCFSQYRVHESKVEFTEGILTHGDIREIGRQIGGLERQSVGRSMLAGIKGQEITDPLELVQGRVQSLIVKEFDMSGIIVGENGSFAFKGDPRPDSPWYRMEGVTRYNRQSSKTRSRT